jgi:small GTP-binding protein
MTFDDSIVSFKGVLLGDSGVGKTSLITRWTTGSYSKPANPTIGTHHQRQRISLDGHEIDFFIWDTAGQEQFQALTPLYARSSAVAIITVSIIESASLSSIDRWVSLLSSANDVLPPIVLAVNKVDLRESAVKSEEEIQEEFGQRFAGIFFVSAATNEEVNNLFMFAALVGLRFTLSPNVHESTITLTEPPPRSRSCCN